MVKFSEFVGKVNHLNDTLNKFRFCGYSEEEWENMYGSCTQNKYTSFIGQETAFYDIATLFYLRGNKEKATEYANKLSPDRRNDFGGYLRIHRFIKQLKFFVEIAKPIN